MAQVGRPTKYLPEYCQKVDEYLATTGREQTSLPMVEGFAVYLDVNKTTLYEWAKDYPEFSNALGKIKVKQLLQLVDDGIYGGKEVNSTIVKLLLQNNHGMKERKDYTSGDKPVPILNALSTNNSNPKNTEVK
jgi:hypothetical protein